MLRGSLALLWAVLMVATAALAHEQKAGALRIVHPWTFETRDPAAAAVVVSMTIHNSGRKADRLLSAASPLAAKAELRPGKDAALASAPVSIPAGGKVELKASGAHVELTGVAKPLSGYDTFPMTLVFERAGKINIEVMVEERH